jgi:hypothetical protein
MELQRRTWSAAVRLAAVISVLAAVLAVAVQAAGNVPQVAIVLPAMAIAFTASWIQTGRVRRELAPVRRIGPPHRSAA